MLDKLKINHYSSTPIYKQIVHSIIRMAEEHALPPQSKLPSINEVSIMFDLGRGTVEKAYKELKELQIIEAVHGKGYFLLGKQADPVRKIFLLFNKLSAHKKIIYDAFVKELGGGAFVDFFVYHNNVEMFRHIFEYAREDYTDYVIIPHFYSGEDKAFEIIDDLPREKLLILDKKIKGIRGEYRAVYQNFEKDIYETLQQAREILFDKYRTLKIVYPHQSYHPREILNGFQQFIVEHLFSGKIVPDIELEDIEAGDVFITLADDDLVTLVKRAKTAGLKIGSELGILSYNDNPLKEILLDGITVMSTDFELMGRSAAGMILDGEKGHHENPFYLILRHSL